MENKIQVLLQKLNVVYSIPMNKNNPAKFSMKS